MPARDSPQPYAHHDTTHAPVFDPTQLHVPATHAGARLSEEHPTLLPAPWCLEEHTAHRESHSAVVG